MRTMITLLALALTSPALADQACLTAPTQACVFDMAVVAANASGSLQDNVTALISIAALQERADSLEASATTTDQVIALVQAREPEVARQGRLWDLAAQIAADQITDAPVLATRMAESIKGDDRTSMRARIGFAALAGDTETVIAMLAAVPKGDSEGLARIVTYFLLMHGDYAQAYAIGERHLGIAHVDYGAVEVLLVEGNLAAAEVVAAGMSEPDMRADALIKVAKALAQRGETAKAMTFAKLATDLSNQSASSDHNVLDRAELLALLGDTTGAEALLASNPSEEIEFRPAMPARIRLIVALVTGNQAEFDAQIAELGPELPDYDVKEAALACLQAATCELSQVLAVTKGPNQAGALNAIGLLQARAGDSAAALASLVQLRATGPDAHVHGDFRRALVQVLAGEGKVVLALELAEQSGSPHLLAELASLL